MLLNVVIDLISKFLPLYMINPILAKLYIYKMLLFNCNLKISYIFES
jgi:hypothetical protein